MKPAAAPRFGLFDDFRNPPSSGRSAGAGLRRELQPDQISEHYFTGDGYTPAPLALATAIAAKTSTVRIGTNVVLLPLHDPLRLAG